MSVKVKIAVIESYIGENFLSYSAFCKRCGISIATFNKLDAGKMFA